jgi:P-type Cu2+ transporter
VSTTETGCELCGLPLSRTPITNDGGDFFCCLGCRNVHDALGDIDIDTGNRDEAEICGALDAEGREELPEHYESAFLHVDGMHCSTCEVFLESIATDHGAIGAAEASYVTDTVRIEYDGNHLSEADLTDVLSRTGYTAYRRDDTLTRRRSEDRELGRLAAGVLFGMMVMFQYVTIIYPTYFAGFLYDERTATFLTEALASGPARYYFLIIWTLTTVVLFYTGGPILRGAYVSLKARAPNMDLLVALAAVSAYAYSTLAFVVGRTDVYYDVTVAIVVVVTVGSYYERSTKRAATDRLSDLTEAQVDEARRYDVDGETRVVDVADLQAGDRILVRAGERVPVDGTVIDGESTVDEAVITGESLPIAKRKGDVVVGGAVLTSGVSAIEVGEDARSSVDRIANLVWNLQSSNHGIQRLADRLAMIFVPTVLLLAVVVALAHLGFGAGVTGALLVGLTVLIVSCPCALGLATPLAVASGVREALEKGIVVFDDTVFERLREVDTVVFDKTGTLTTGEMELLETNGPDELFELVGELERHSSHPVARAIADGLADRRRPGGGGDEHITDGGEGVSRPFEGIPESTGDSAGRNRRVTGFEGYSDGVRGIVDGHEVLVGHPDRFAKRGWTVSEELLTKVETARKVGRVPVVIGRDGIGEGLVVVGDEPREGWVEAVTRLKRRGIEIVVLTGDEETATDYFRRHSQVDRVFAGVPPEAKAETIRRLSLDRQIAMVGDGTNDAPALASADLGIALGGGTALAVDAADVAIIEDDLALIETAFELSNAAGRRVKQNIGWAFLYNAIAIPIAVAGYLNPLFAALAMATSSLLVVTNSSRQLLADDPTHERSESESERV